MTALALALTELALMRRPRVPDFDLAAVNAGLSRVSAFQSGQFGTIEERG